MTADFKSLYENDREANQHRLAIERISSVTGKALTDIEFIYENALSDLKKRAHFKDYLPILVARKVESLVRA